MKNNRLGIIGGGQLGMFICIAAKKKNIKSIVLSESEEFSAKNFCDRYFISDFKNLNNLDKFIDSADYFTIETENVPISIIHYIEKKKKVFPSSKVIEIAQNRLKEKKFLNSIDGIKTTKYLQPKNFDDFKYASKNFNFSCILKSTKLGYDGKGQYKISKNNLEIFKEFDFNNFILEKVVDFKKEVSVIIVKSKENTINYPTVENIHKESILRESIYPAKISKKVESDAITKSFMIANQISLNGVLAVEMFILENDQILINELAPRPHNSGHWSMDACNESQYDNLIKSIFFNKLTSPQVIRKCRMINLIGDDYKKIESLKKKYRCYDYYKKEIRNSRKMGHYIILDQLNS
tara:strand:+ start:518 stop:1570 length:1053 start_codon:yes stop_codon:yes gene_type:complete